MKTSGRRTVLPFIGLFALAATVTFEWARAGEESGEAAARAAGVRFGQAAGVELVCYGMKSTETAAALKARYSGPAAAAAFDEEATKVLAAWRDLLTCKSASGPNECRISQAMSCRAAMREIGPGGSAIPDLIEQK